MSNLIALPAGTVLVDDYRIERVLGAGGFGVTYLADEIALARLVTIKEYFPSDFAARAGGIEAAPRTENCASDYQWGLDRFIEEAQTLAKFNHPNIVRVYRYFRANSTGYMVLHFEEGQSLKTWLKGLGRAPRQKELDDIVAPLLDALEVVHAADFLHRDIAPDNIIIRKDGSPVLIDFGSARGEIASHSKTVSALVKPGYSPYEQYAETSRQQGPWTDIYALAATLYHAVTGKRPPDAPSRMVADDYVPAREAALSSYRARFLKAIDAALTLNVEARPRTVAAWRGELLAPDPQPGAKRGWMPIGRKGGADAAVTPDPNDSAATVRLPGRELPGAPPPPDAPGPPGGLVDFVDGLKADKAARAPGAGRKPLAAALAKVQAGEPDRPAQARSAAKAPGDDVLVATEPPGRRADARPMAEPEKNSAGSARRGGLFPFGRKSTSAPSKPDRSKAGAAARNASEVRAAEPQRLPVPVRSPPAPVALERRKPPRPKAQRPDGGWRSALTRFALVAGIAAVAIAAQDHVSRGGWSDFWGREPTGAAGPGAAGPGAPAQSVRQRPATEAVRPAATAPVSIPVNPLMREIAAHDGAIHAVAYSPDGRFVVTAGADATLKIWDSSLAGAARVVPMNHGAARTIAVAGQTIATGHADGYVSLWDLATGVKLADFQRNEASIWAVAATAVPGRFLAASHDWKVTLWDRASPGDPVHVFSGHDSAVQAVAAGRGPLMASGGADRQVKVWNLETLDTVRTYARLADFVTAVALTDDGRLAAAGLLNGEVGVFSANSRRVQRRLRGHKGRINTVAFVAAADAATPVLVSGSADGTIRVWNLRRGTTLRTFASHQGSVTALSVSADGRRLVTAGDDGRLRVWNLELAIARGRR
ncbi:MAG: protein kinase [Hyphomicrobiaceae bacterium]|nr:protein kinase [Hyphomicrobiaceae bacterium]